MKGYNDDTLKVTMTNLLRIVMQDNPVIIGELIGYPHLFQ
jgi:hypothetical protein